MKIVHKMIISLTDDEKVIVSGIPDNLEVALSIIHDVTRTVVSYHMEKVKVGNRPKILMPNASMVALN